MASTVDNHHIGMKEFPSVYTVSNTFPAYPINNPSNVPSANFPHPQVSQQYPAQNVQYAPNAFHPAMNNIVYSAQPTTVTNTIIIQELKLSSDPITTQCPNCKQLVTTSVEYKSGTRTHAAAFALCMLDKGCCALLPYCCNKAKDAHHTCPNSRTISNDW